MTIASKTVLLQMRFVRAGAPFCPVTTRTNIDGTDGWYRQGAPFFGFSDEITPPIYTYADMPVRRGAPFRITAMRQLRYGGVYQGGPIFSQLPNPTYTPYEISPVRRGTAFNWTTTRTNIDAQNFDFYYQGGPFWVDYAEPSTFDAATFFIVF